MAATTYKKYYKITEDSFFLRFDSFSFTHKRSYRHELPLKFHATFPFYFSSFSRFFNDFRLVFVYLVGLLLEEMIFLRKI